MCVEKRLFALVLALVLALSLGASVFADDAPAQTGTITVKNPTVVKAGINPKSGGKDSLYDEHAVYNCYRIFELESYNKEQNAYLYKLNSDWEDFIKNGAGADYITVSEDGIITPKDSFTDDTASAFAAAALKYASEHDFTPDVVLKDIEERDSSGKRVKNGYSVSDLPLGYYLVDSSVGVLCSLSTTDAEAIIEEKNAVPTIDKWTQEDSLKDIEDAIKYNDANQTVLWLKNGWSNIGLNGDTDNDAELGEDVQFWCQITVQKGAQNYVMHDTMTHGFTSNNDVTVSVGGVAVAAENYTVVYDPEDGDTFDVIFADDYVAGLEAGTKIDVYYTAYLNPTAATSWTCEHHTKYSNDNTVYLSYGDDNRTESVITKTFSYCVPFYKYYEVPDEEDPDDPWKEDLTGASFRFYRLSDGAQYQTEDGIQTVVPITGVPYNPPQPVGLIKLEPYIDGEDRYDMYRVAIDGVDNPEDIIYEFTNEYGYFVIDGLDCGMYQLEETNAPAGYNKLTEPIVCAPMRNLGSLKHDNPIRYCGPGDNNGYVLILNQSGSVLPETGGIGTTVFYAVGAVLVLGAAVVLFAKKRVEE